MWEAICFVWIAAGQNKKYLENEGCWDSIWKMLRDVKMFGSGQRLIKDRRQHGKSQDHKAVVTIVWWFISYHEFLHMPINVDQTWRE